MTGAGFQHFGAGLAANGRLLAAPIDDEQSVRAHHARNNCAAGLTVFVDYSPMLRCR
jgi:hypothetical protein